MVIYGNRAIGLMTMMKMVTTGYQVYGLPHQIPVCTGRPLTGAIPVDSTDFTLVIGARMLVFMVALTMVTAMAAMAMAVAGGKATNFATIPRW